MKTSIKLTALLLLAGASAFAAVPAKAVVPSASPVVTFSALPADKGIEVKVENETGKAIVTITDKDGDILRKDALSSTKGFEKGYILTSLDNGDYTITVTANGTVVKEDIHVYDEGDSKMFIVKG